MSAGLARPMRASVIRYALAAAVALAGLVGLMLLVRPLIFTLAPPRDDSVYAVAATGAVGATPRLADVLLNAPHGLDGERQDGQHAAITIFIARSLTGQFSVVNAWSSVNGCVVTIAADRLRDCKGSAWTFAGDPIDPTRVPLQRFPVRVENGAVIVDFTHPVGDGG